MKAHISSTARCFSRRAAVPQTRGAVFVEAALAIPVLLALVAMAFDIGSWLYTRSTMADATAVAVRSAAVTIADYLDPVRVSNPHTACNASGDCLYTCNAAAGWGQSVAENVILRRMGTAEGITTTVIFGSASFQPTVSLRFEHPYRCLWCAGFMRGMLVSEATALVEDTNLTRCEESPGIATSPCSPLEGERCR